MVCSLAYSATGSLLQSEDLAQETFLAVWKNLSALRDSAKLRPWLCGIARNLAANFLRQQVREPSHRAESLDNIAKTPSSEPMPVERAISQEEAGILWRSLERIPETYREPLVLYYREHQSAEAVAQKLDLTEEAVRQRLARGRKLLRQELLSFVETALERSAPGAAFTQAVIAVLPDAVISAKTAAVGAATAKGGAGAKGALFMAGLGSVAGFLGALALSCKNAADEARLQPERRLLVKAGWIEIAFVVVSSSASFYFIPRLVNHPFARWLFLSALILAFLIYKVVMVDCLGRQRAGIIMEEGDWAGAQWGLPDQETDRKAFSKRLKSVIPFLLIFAAIIAVLPWNQHWLRSSALVAALGLLTVWNLRRHKKMLRLKFEPQGPFSQFVDLLRHPVISKPLFFLGIVGVCIGLEFFFYPVKYFNYSVLANDYRPKSDRNDENEWNYRSRKTKRPDTLEQ